MAGTYFFRTPPGTRARFCLLLNPPGKLSFVPSEVITGIIRQIGSNRWEKFAFPMPGVVVPIDQEFTVGGSQIRVHYLAGAGTVTNQNGKYAALKAMTTPAQGAKLYGSKGIHWISRPQPFVGSRLVIQLPNGRSCSGASCRMTA